MTVGQEKAVLYVRLCAKIWVGSVQHHHSSGDTMDLMAKTPIKDVFKQRWLESYASNQ